MRDLVLQYYFTIDAVLKNKPHLELCLKQCKHCRIKFFTHPRNKCRSDLRCPFGCREAHRKKSSTKRSTEYYKTPKGRLRKKRLNCKLKNTAPEVDSTKTKEKKEADQKKTLQGEDTRTVNSQQDTPEKEIHAKPSETEVATAANIKFNDGIVEHVQVVTSLIEARRVSLAETQHMLNQVFRQHSLGQEKRIDYIVRYLNKNPP